MASLAHNKSTKASDIVGWGPEVRWSKTGFLPPVWTSGELLSIGMEMGKNRPGQVGHLFLEVEGTDGLQIGLKRQSGSPQ